jgi:hypothetical protein
MTVDPMARTVAHGRTVLALGRETAARPGA